MQVLKFLRYWTVKDTKEYNDYLFIFGDNNIKKGLGGQAIIRYQSNAMGIPTKKIPSYDKNAYYSDDEYDDNIKHIDTAIEKIKEKLKTGKYKGIIISNDGIGTGLADLENKAPKTNEYLNKVFKELKKFTKSNKF